MTIDVHVKVSGALTPEQILEARANALKLQQSWAKKKPPVNITKETLASYIEANRLAYDYLTSPIYRMVKEHFDQSGDWYYSGDPYNGYYYTSKTDPLLRFWLYKNEVKFSNDSMWRAFSLKSPKPLTIEHPAADIILEIIANAFSYYLSCNATS